MAVRMISSNAGKREVKKLLAAPGNAVSLFMCGWNNCNGGVFIFFKVLANTGPARMIVGMATIIPYRRTVPRFALNWL